MAREQASLNVIDVFFLSEQFSLGLELPGNVAKTPFAGYSIKPANAGLRVDVFIVEW